MDNIDTKIAETVRKINRASIKYQGLIAHDVKMGSDITIEDIFKSGLAQDILSQLGVEHELLLSEKYPNHFSLESIEYLYTEHKRLSKRIEAWESRELPF